MQSYLLRFIKARISPKLLALFQDHYLDSVDEAIVKKVIVEQVLTDLNLVSGRQKVIALKDCDVTYTSADEIIVNIPDHLRDYSSLSDARLVFNNSVEVITSLGMSQNYQNTFSIKDKLRGNSGVAGNTLVKMAGAHHVIITGDNINSSLIYDSYLVVDVEYTTAFETIGRDYYPSMGRIAVNAARMLLYTMRLELEDGRIQAYGSDKFLEAVNNFDSAEIDYAKDLDELGLIGFANDEKKMDTYVTYLV